MTSVPHVSPRVRAYGKARIDITRRARDEAEWRRLWKDPSQPYAFMPGDGWKFNLTYAVDDYAAEIGFLIDVLGFPVLAFSPSQAQLASPEGGFSLTILSAREDQPATPPDALRIGLNVKGLASVAGELERRGVSLDQQPAPIQADSSWQSASFRTPHGLVIELLSAEPAGQGQVEAGQIVEELPQSESWDEDQPAEDEPAIDNSGDQLEESQESKPQPSAWHAGYGARGVQKDTRVNPVKSVKPGNGNLELTYDALDEDEVGDGGTENEEDFP